jgi:hypothetical protein
MRTYLTIALSCLALLFLDATALGGQSVGLCWNPYQDQTVTGFKVYEGMVSRGATGSPPFAGYTNVITVLGASQTNAVFANLPVGAICFFSATAFITVGGTNLESYFSGEVSYGPIRPSPPSIQTPYLALSWDGPYTIWGSSNLVAWSPLLTTPFNTASLPIVLGQQFFRVSNSQSNLLVIVKQSPAS